MLYAVILAGGKGERFWPLSRQLDPKQFLKVGYKDSLIQNTVSRINRLIPPRNILVVTNSTYSFEIRKQLKKFNIPSENILLEPEGKNTAAAIGWAALHLVKRDPESIMLVLPSDHMILNKKEFDMRLLQAAILAKRGLLVTLGALPSRPSSGYGYIKVKNKIAGQKNAYKVERFIEKPDEERARKLINSGRCFWNCGIFAWRSSVILDEMKKYTPQLYKKLIQVNNINFKKIWQKFPSISIDYAVLEKSNNVAMVSTNMGWTDLGCWRAFDEVLKKDKYGNIFCQDHLDINSRNITVWAQDKLVATIGLNNIVIADTPDALLVCNKNETEKVKQIVGMLKNKRRPEYILHKTVKRPWGTYTVLDFNSGFAFAGSKQSSGWKIKLVEVEPKQRLSLQFHRKRAEHWVVVDGKAKITYGKKIKYVRANESIYIPSGKIHRLENSLNIPLKIVEVQTGRYLEEDDIVRLSDDYKRQ